MKASIQSKVDHYLEILSDLKARTKDEALAGRILSEVAKDVRMEQIREEREMKNGEAATTKQLQFLKRLGVDIQPGITKAEASRLIDEQTGKADGDE